MDKFMEFLLHVPELNRESVAMIGVCVLVGMIMGLAFEIDKKD